MSDTNEPRCTIEASVSHINNTYRRDYPKTPKRRSIGNVPPALHARMVEFARSQNKMGMAEALAALLDFVEQHEAKYEEELKELRKTTNR